MAADYGRRALGKNTNTMQGICPQPSGDYNPLFLCENNSGGSILSSRNAAGPRPLEWSLPARSAGGANTPKLQSTSSAGGSSNSSSSYTIPATWSTKGLIDDVAAGRTPAAKQYAAALAAAGLKPGSAAAGAASRHAGSIAGIPGMGVSREAGASVHKQQPYGAALLDPAAGVSPAYQGPLLGPEIAGYKSVVTKNPVSPSGYSLAPVAEQPGGLEHTRPAAAAGQTYRRQGPAAAPQNGHAGACTSSAMCSNAAHPHSAATAAAAAALATLGSRSRTAPTAEVEAPAADHRGSYRNCALPEFRIADAAVAAGLDSPAPVLTWHVLDQPLGGSSAAAARPGTLTVPVNHPVAGRRAAPTWTTAAAVGGPVSSASSSVPSSNSRSSKPKSARAAAAAADSQDTDYVPSSSSSSRPPSQQMSEGLSKLKQLSTQRLVSRIATPPAEAQDMSATFTATSPALVAGGSCSRSSSSAGRKLGKNSCGRVHVAAAAAPAPAGWNEEHEWQQQQQQPRRQQQQNRDAANGHQPSAYSSGRSNGGSRAPAGQQVSRGGNSAVTAVTATAGRGFGASQCSSSFPAQDAAADGYDGSSSSSSSQMPGGEQLQECATCGRSFLPSALERHAKICVKVFCEKRKVFNARARRLPADAAKLSAEVQQQGEGNSRTAAAAAGRSGGRATSGSSRQHDNRPAVSTATAKKSKWQLQSEQLRSAMRSTNGSSGGSYGHAGGGYPAAQPAEDTRILCPHCGRRFAELAAERHIPKCADIIAKPKELKAGGGKAAYMRSNSRR